jgi:hypothetical protein
MTSIEKSICIRPRPQPTRFRNATTFAESTSSGAPETSSYQGVFVEK